MQSPTLIVVVSSPGMHRVFCDGILHYTGGTEIDCSRYLRKHIHGWPDIYAIGSSYGREWDVYAQFIRSE